MWQLRTKHNCWKTNLCPWIFVKLRLQAHVAQQDALYQLARHEQTIIAQLRTRPLNTTLSHEDNGHIESVICPCGLEEQTPSHSLHTCPLHTAERECTWTTKSSREDKLQGTATDLRQCGSLLWLDCDIWLTVHIERWIRS